MFWNLLLAHTNALCPTTAMDVIDELTEEHRAAKASLSLFPEGSGKL